ncbi:MAG: sulfate transporter, partial [Gammaproteobacteria bacterium]
ILGSVPAGLPSLHIAVFESAVFKELFADAAGIALVSFTSGVLTAVSFHPKGATRFRPNGATLKC